LLIHTNDSLYATALANSGRTIVGTGALLSEINRGHAASKLFFISCILIKDLQKVAYIINTVHIESIFEQIAKRAKTTLFSV